MDKRSYTIPDNIISTEIAGEKILVTKMNDDNKFYELEGADSIVYKHILTIKVFNQSDLLDYLSKNFELLGLPTKDYLNKLLTSLVELSLVIHLGPDEKSP